MIFVIILWIQVREVWISIGVYNLVKLIIGYGVDVIVCMDNGLDC